MAPKQLVPGKAGRQSGQPGMRSAPKARRDDARAGSADRAPQRSGLVLRPVVCSSVPSRFDLLLVKSSSGVPGTIFFLRPVPEYVFVNIFIARFSRRKHPYDGMPPRTGMADDSHEFQLVLEHLRLNDPEITNVRIAAWSPEYAGRLSAARLSAVRRGSVQQCAAL